jgi:KDO2-lipid IV(A) lauroyltransferase
MWLYYLLIRPLSLLPLRVLYGISALCYFLLRFLFGYRKKVLEGNLQRAFPALGAEERTGLVRANYRHLSDLLAEGIKNLGIGKKELQERMQLENPELFEDLYQKGKSVVLLSSHMENWEFFITAQAMLMPHRAFGIGKPLSQGFLNTKINGLRERFGMRVIHAGNFREVLERELPGTPLAVLTLLDQSPSPDNAYWTPFMGQTTAFAFGGEFMAHEYTMAVVYLRIEKRGRGYYKATAELICEDPSTQSYGTITDAYVQRLERDIRESPGAWLWTHKRWKHTPPKDLEAVQAAHRERFEKRFGKR